MKNKYFKYVLVVLSFLFLKAEAENDYLAYCTKTVMDQIYTNDSLIKAGNTQNLNFVIDVRYEEFQMVDRLDGLSQLNDRLKVFYTSGYNPKLSTDTKVGIYVILLSKQPPLSATPSFGFESKDELLALTAQYDKAKYNNYMTKVKNKNLPGFDLGSQYDQIWVQLCENIKTKLKEKQSITFNNNKGAILNITNFVKSRTKNGYPIIGRKASFLLGKKLNNETMQTVLKQTNAYLISKKPTDVMPLYHSTTDASGYINLYVTALEAGLNGLKNNATLPGGAKSIADESGLDAENGMVLYPTTGVNLANIKLAYTNKWIGQQKPVGTEINYKNNSLIKYIDHAGITIADPTFLDRFFNLQDISGFSLQSLQSKLSSGILFSVATQYKIIITSKESFDINEIPTAIQQAAQAKVNNENTVYIGLHVDFNDGDNIQVYTTCTDKLLATLKDYKQNQGYSWYKNKTTGKIIFAQGLQYKTGNFYDEWLALGKYVTTSTTGSTIYNNYSNHYYVYLALKTYVDIAKPLDSYLGSDEFGYIFMEGYVAVLLAPVTGGASLEGFAVKLAIRKTGTNIAKGVIATIVGNTVVNYITKDEIPSGQFGKAMDYTLRNTKTKDYVNNILEEFLDGNPIVENTFKCYTAVTDKLAEDDGVGLGQLSFECVKSVGLNILIKTTFKTGSSVFGKLKAKLNANPTAFITKMQDMGFVVNDNTLTEIQILYNLNFDLKSIVWKALKASVVPQKLGVSYKINLTDFNGFTVNTNDFIDLMVHTDNGAYKAIVENSGTYIEKALSTQDLADLINTLPAGKAVRLLSCNDLSSAKDLSKLINGREMYASDGWVDMFKDGTLASQNAFKKLINGIEVQSVGKYSSNSTKPKVRLGDAVNGAGSLLDDIVLAMKADFPSTWKFNKIGDDAFEVLDGTGKKWGTVYQDKIVCPARTQIGTAGNPILNKATLVKNMKYEVDGIIYQTDELGRVLKTNADLDDIARVRLGNQQIRAVDVKDGVRGVDQGGHIVGSRFFGPGEQINLYPQSANLNQGAWKTMENGWADAMVAGKDVKIEVEAIFSGASKRPDAFDVSYWIDGVKTKTSFINQ
jgi:hypothetical protein